MAPCAENPPQIGERLMSQLSCHLVSPPTLSTSRLILIASISETARTYITPGAVVD